MTQSAFTINSDEFAKAIDNWVAKTKLNANTLIIKIGTMALETVVRLSPVGNPSQWQNPVAPKGYIGGNFRNNWRVGINAPAPATVESPPDASGALSGAEAAKILAAQNITEINIGNGAPYAMRLEYGWSNQAPSGMVRIAIQDIRNSFSQLAAETMRQ